MAKKIIASIELDNKKITLFIDQKQVLKTVMVLDKQRQANLPSKHP